MQQGVVVRHARSMTPLRCPAANCGAQHPRRDTLEAAVQADPGLRNRAGRIGGGTIGDEDLRSRGFWYGWDQDSLGIGPPLDAVSMDDLRQTIRNREQSAAALGRRTCAPEHSCARHPQPRYVRASAEPGLGDAELAPTSD